MSEHQAEISWVRKGDSFLDKKYSREHIWKFDGGIEIRASASPSVVPIPYSSAESVDPEESFVASISSCHMLFFLSIAAKKGFIVNSYKDKALGILSKNSDKLSITSVKLNPIVEFEGDNQPDKNMLSEIHKESHENCFIANSVKTDIEIVI
tara:strand:- start:38139 stop:38594 length:456 start_codon:yes stop_codon:yes gene_type:complete